MQSLYFRKKKKQTVSDRFSHIYEYSVNFFATLFEIWHMIKWIFYLWDLHRLSSFIIHLFKKFLCCLLCNWTVVYTFFLRLTIPRETIRSIITITWHSILDKEFIFNKMQIVSLDRNIMTSLFHSRFVRMCVMKSWNIGQARRFSLIIKSVIGMCMRSH
jgi:hypothetical protein